MAYLTNDAGTNRLTSDDGLDLLIDDGSGGGVPHPVGIVSCLGLGGYGVARRTGVFSGKGGGIGTPHTVGLVSRLGLDGYGLRRYRTFSGKPNADQGPHTVAEITRLALDGYGVRRAGTYAGKGAPGGPRTVGRITRLGLDGYGVRRYGSFAGRTSPSSHPVGLLTRLGLDGYGVRRYRTFAGKTAAPSIVPTTGAFDPGFWTEEHRKIKEREERKAEPAAAPVTPLAAIPALIAPPRAWTDDDELQEILELMAIMDDDARLS